VATQQQRDQYLGLVVTGWILALYAPPAALVVGLFLVNRRDGHALALLAVSLITITAAILAFLILTTG
jgi:hypothetical protein